MTPALFIAVVLVALAMAYMNGFHDASNAVSTTITTRTLPERTALAMAALLNLLGGLLGLSILTVSADWALGLLGLEQLTAATSEDPQLLGVALLAIMITTIGWDLITWWFGMPSSTWHAFFSSVLGVSLAIGAPAAWGVLGTLLLVSLVGPLISAALGFALMRLVLLLGRHERVRRGHLHFAQIVSAGAVATGHGISDSRLPLAVVVVAATAAPATTPSTPAMMVAVALAVGAGTLMGGHRIIRTLGRRLTDLSVAQGLAAETSSAATMSLSLFGFDAPLSSSHSLASSVVGAGAAKGLRTVRWPVARTIVLVWLATPLSAIVIAAATAGVMLELSPA